MQLVSVSCPSENSAGSVMISLVTTGLLNTEDYLPSGFNHAEGSLSGWNEEVMVLVVLFLLTSPILSFGGSFTVCSMRFSSAFFTWLIVVQCFCLTHSKSCFSPVSEPCNPWLPSTAQSHGLASASFTKQTHRIPSPSAHRTQSEAGGLHGTLQFKFLLHSHAWFLHWPWGIVVKKELC